MSDYEPAPDELRDAWINESTSFPCPDQLENQEQPPTENTANSWEQIENQLSYWQDMDNQYWQWRKQTAYEAYLKRTYGKI
jgi:hypothetical protein